MTQFNSNNYVTIAIISTYFPVKSTWKLERYKMVPDVGYRTIYNDITETVLAINKFRNAVENADFDL